MQVFSPVTCLLEPNLKVSFCQRSVTRMALSPLTNRNDEMEGDFLVQDSSCVLNLPIQK